MDVNRCIIHGRLTVDPNLHYTDSEIAVVRFPIACERPYQAAGDGKKKVDYIPIISWRSYAERLANNLKKGQECAVIGRLQSMVRQEENINRHEIMTQDVIFGQMQRGLSLDMNQVFLTGRLTSDPELHYVGAKDVAVCRFTLAVERDYPSKGSGKPDVDYIPVLAWRSYAERLANDLKKGAFVAAFGRLQSRKHHSHPHITIHEIHADQVKYG